MTNEEHQRMSRFCEFIAGILEQRYFGLHKNDLAKLCEKYQVNQKLFTQFFEGYFFEMGDTWFDPVLADEARSEEGSLRAKSFFGKLTYEAIRSHKPKRKRKAKEQADD